MTRARINHHRWWSTDKGAKESQSWSLLNRYTHRWRYTHSWQTIIMTRSPSTTKYTENTRRHIYMSPSMTKTTRWVHQSTTDMHWWLHSYLNIAWSMCGHWKWCCMTATIRRHWCHFQTTTCVSHIARTCVLPQNMHYSLPYPLLPVTTWNREKESGADQ